DLVNNRRGPAGRDEPTGTAPIVPRARDDVHAPRAPDRAVPKSGYECPAPHPGPPPQGGRGNRSLPPPLRGRAGVGGAGTTLRSWKDPGGPDELLSDSRRISAGQGLPCGGRSGSPRGELSFLEREPRVAGRAADQLELDVVGILPDQLARQR